ncbi:MAG: RNA polymerase sigma factor RpoH [Desulfuromonadales bacterium]|nr:RNA polymerase sigma factor RpoH [Desulfuromonadales bacterium]
MSQTYLPVVGDGFEHYMAQVNRFDLLTAEEEHELAVRLQRDGDLEAAHRLVCANLRFVVKVALEYRGYGLRLLDLVQEGNIGLMQAVRKFDPERGLRLITYAVWWIRAYIQSYIMKSWSLVKIGTTQAQKKLFYKLAQTRNALRNLTGAASAAEVADELEVDQAVVEEMDRRLGQRDLSLDVELGQGDNYTLLDILPDRRASQETTLIAREERCLLGNRTRVALAVLPSRERQIIEQRILGDKPRTLQEIADEFGISRERVRQLEQSALRRLKVALADLEDR